MSISSQIVELDSVFTLIKKAVIRQRAPLAMFQSTGLRFNHVEPNIKTIKSFQMMFGCKELPVSYMFIQGFRCIGQLLVSSKIPSKLMGMIHLTSNYKVVKAHDWLKPVDIEVRINSCVDSEKGLIYSLSTYFYQLGQLTLVNENEFLDKRTNYQSSKNNKVALTAPDIKTIDKSHYSQQLARQYAKVSGDYNPIHIHPLLAKVFGLKSSVMHGMYGLHWMLTHQHILTSKAEEEISHHKTVTVSFNRPCYLPKTVLLTESIDQQSYALYSEGFKDRFIKLAFN
ncbi:MaoC/PaaZ C-terminal domain-containing protein [Thalassotalea profundi]|uniref:MaoC-like domain-containing protein n=1 Tax=Thalassotalea profundi TaxID=2036687 RepID=A0ABQ3J4W8_9GAMM|nr:MaoC/PaaZ C-terminal domain-containing protein [Thalassotalea profundi]GHF02816.1 hypothetical protein GCM10011501_35130 [Thalassotalea profundi]